jgi:hypothetical protein
MSAKTKSELALWNGRVLPLVAELIDEMEASAFAPNAYALDSSLFTPEIIIRIQHYQKPWVADSKKNRILTYKGQRYNCETFEQTLPSEAFREITL